MYIVSTSTFVTIWTDVTVSDFPILPSVGERLHQPKQKANTAIKKYGRYFIKLDIKKAVNLLGTPPYINFRSD